MAFLKKEKSSIDIENELFFGKRKDSEFLSEKVNGFSLYARKESRVNAARLYMCLKGYTIEEILSDRPEINEKKRMVGEEFYSVITSRNKQETALIYAAMAVRLSKEKLPDLVVENDVGLTDNYNKFIFLVHAFKDITELIDFKPKNIKERKLKDAIKEKFSISGKDIYGDAKEKIQKSDMYDIIKSSEIKANPDMKKRVEESIKGKEERIRNYKEKAETYSVAKVSYDKMERQYAFHGEEINKAKNKKRLMERDLVLRAKLVGTAVRDAETSLEMVGCIVGILAYGFTDGFILDKAWELTEKVNTNEEKLESSLKEIERLMNPIMAEEWEENTVRLKDINEMGHFNGSNVIVRKEETELLKDFGFKGVTKIKPPEKHITEAVLEKKRKGGK